MSHVLHNSVGVYRRGRRNALLSDDRTSRRTAGDFSALRIVPGVGYTPQPGDYHSIRHIPSTSTGLRDDDIVTVFTSSSGHLTTSPIAGCPELPVSPHNMYEGASSTAAQRIADRYRQRHLSSSSVPKGIPFSESTILDGDQLLNFFSRPPTYSEIELGVRRVNLPISLNYFAIGLLLDYTLGKRRSAVRWQVPLLFLFLFTFLFGGAFAFGKIHPVF